jgi:NAD(P)H-dependent flavin oxidoreductase YrpB (nitropropane dioxygenase family)
MYVHLERGGDGMKTTRLCELLGIEYPILQGGMVWIANAELAAAVSNAGGLGLISPTAGMSRNGNQVDNLKGQIKTARGLTSRLQVAQGYTQISSRRLGAKSFIWWLR